MKVYVVMWFEDYREDWNIVRVFSSRDKAEEYLNSLGGTKASNKFVREHYDIVESDFE